MPEVGQVYRWEDMTLHVLSVGRDWAKVRVVQPNGATWRKRQPLPFPDDFTLVSDEA